MRIEQALIHAILTHLPAEADQAERTDAERLLWVAFDIATDDYPSSPPAAAHLSAIRTGYGCWIDDVRRAMVDARPDFPGGEESDFWPVMYGALSMACVWLEHMHRANNWKPAPTPAPALS